MTLALNLVSEAFVRRVRQAVLMAAPATAPSAGDVVDAAACAAADVDWRSYLLHGAMLLAMLLALAILLVLLARRRRSGRSRSSTERPIDFLTLRPLVAARLGPASRRGSSARCSWCSSWRSCAIPIGVGAAVYLEEYARDTALTRFIRTNIRNLAGVPAIVYGLLGLAVFVTLLGAGQDPDRAAD